MENVCGSSQYFIFLSTLLEKKSVMLQANLRSVFVQHLSKLDSKFSKYSIFQKIYLTMNEFAILLTNPAHRPSVNKKKKTTLTLLVIIPEKEAQFRKSNKILDFIEWRIFSIGEKSSKNDYSLRYVVLV